MNNIKTIPHIYEDILNLKNIYKSEPVDNLKKQIKENNNKITEARHIISSLFSIDNILLRTPSLYNEERNLDKIINNIKNYEIRLQIEKSRLDIELSVVESRLINTPNKIIDKIIYDLLNFMIIPKTKLDSKYHNELCGISLEPLINHDKIFCFYGCGHLFGMCDFFKNKINKTWGLTEEMVNSNLLCPYCKSNDLDTLLFTIKKVCEDDDKLHEIFTNNFIKKIC